MEIHLVGESVKFMILGMLVVFTFLYLLVLVMKAQAIVIEKYFPEGGKSSGKTEKSEESEDEERARVAAIIAAVMEYRKAEHLSKG